MAVYWNRFLRRGHPAEREQNLHDLLRLTIAAAEIASTRREALDEVGKVYTDVGLPAALNDYRHATYETSVVYEFSLLAREDFARHNNVPVWERPLAWLAPGKTYWSSGHIDIALFSAARGVETRIEFGKAEIRSQARPLPRDVKLESDALKLFEAQSSRRRSRADSNEGMKHVENFVVVWDERDSRASSRGAAKFTAAKGEHWLQMCQKHAQAAKTRLGFDVELEAAAASALMTFNRDVRRSVYAAIYSVDIESDRGTL